jgi:hypothetical protein
VAEAAEASHLTIGRLSEIFGQDAVLDAVETLPSPVDLREVRRLLNRPLRTQRRQETRRRNAERHRDVIAWRGILDVSAVIDDLMDLPGDMDYDGANMRHGGRARRSIRKARLHWPLELVEYDTGLQMTHEIPADSRLVMDCRRSLGPVCTAEIVHVVGRELRLHLWSRSGGAYPETTARLRRVQTVEGLI